MTELGQGLHEATFNNAESTLTFAESAPNKLLLGVPYVAERLTLTDLGSHVREARGTKSLAVWSRKNNLDQTTVFNTEKGYTVPFLYMADKMYKAIGGRMLCFAISSPDAEDDRQTPMVVAGLDGQAFIRPWIASQYTSQSLTRGDAARKAGITCQRLDGFEKARDKQGVLRQKIMPLTLQRYLSDILSLQLEFCGIRGLKKAD